MQTQKSAAKRQRSKSKTTKKRAQRRRLSVTVGRPWQEAEVHVAARPDPPRLNILKWLVLAGLVLAAAITAQAIRTSDASLLENVLGLANTILVGALGWALGNQPKNEAA